MYFKIALRYLDEILNINNEESSDHIIETDYGLIFSSKAIAYLIFVRNRFDFSRFAWRRRILQNR